MFTGRSTGKAGTRALYMRMQRSGVISKRGRGGGAGPGADHA